MKIRSNIITGQDIGNAVLSSGVQFINTNAREGWHIPIRTFRPRRDWTYGYEIFLTGSSPYAAAHQSEQGGFESEKAATWDEWGMVISALYDIDPGAIIGHYQSREHFIKYTRDEFERVNTYHDPKSYQARSHRAPWLTEDIAA